MNSNQKGKHTKKLWSFAMNSLDGHSFDWDCDDMFWNPWPACQHCNYNSLHKLIHVARSSDRYFEKLTVMLCSMFEHDSKKRSKNLRNETWNRCANASVWAFFLVSMKSEPIFFLRSQKKCNFLNQCIAKGTNEKWTSSVNQCIAKGNCFWPLVRWSWLCGEPQR